MTDHRETERISPGAIVALGGCLGLVAGLAEAGIIAAQWWLAGKIQTQSYHMVWMAPLADTILGLLAGAALGVVHQIVGRRLSGTLLVGLLAAGAAWLVVLQAEGIHWASQLLLAAGMGVTLSRVADRWPRKILGAPYRSLVMAVGVIGVMVLGAFVLPPLKERMIAGRLVAAAPGAPNIVLLVWDTVRRDNLGLYGYSRATTPVLDSLAGDAIVFDRALTASSWTLPSHASMFTGRLPHELSSTWKIALDDHWPTLAEVLTDRGYRTAGFAGNTSFVSFESGLSRGFTHFQDYRLSVGRLFLTPAVGRFLITRNPVRWRLLRNSARQLNDWSLAWLDRQDGDRPFFLFVNYYDAHRPYEPPAPFDTLFGRPAAARRQQLGQTGYVWTTAERDTAMAPYDGGIAYLDNMLGNLLAGLKRRGLLDNTVVIVTSDHGEHFGEHGLILHGNSLYRQLLEVPLLILDPRRPGSHIDEPVSLVNLAATILSLAGGEGGATLPGRSLLATEPVVGGSDSIVAELDWHPTLVRRGGPLAAGPMWSVLSGGRHLIRDGGGRVELYDFAGDTSEAVNLAGGPKEASVQDRLIAMLDRIAAPAAILNSGMQPVAGRRLLSPVGP